MISQAYTQALFQCVDQKDALRFAGHFAPRGRFRFGNADSVVGPKDIEEYVAGFFGYVDAVRHELLECWVQADASVCHGRVVYRRQDQSELAVPFAVILKGQERAIEDYLVFVDNSALFAE